jgi:hypothetical protein
MQLKIETIPTSAGDMHDLVLTQGPNTIRLGLTNDNTDRVLREVSTWLEDNTLDVIDIIRPNAKRKARKGLRT